MLTVPLGPSALPSRAMADVTCDRKVESNPIHNLLEHLFNQEICYGPSCKHRMETSSYSDSNGVRVPQRPLGTRKPLSIVLEEERDASSTSTHRHLSLIDLVSVGVGGTIGSGIFVLAGLIAHNYAGPSTFVSFILSGLAASCSGLCFADFSSRLPSAGSTYVYAFVSLGEWAAVVAGACLTLEYGVSGAAGE